MQRRNNIVSTDAGTIDPDCTFCHINAITPYVLKESTHYRLVSDHAPLIEGHILIIPKQHYACYGAVPAELDRELFSLKQEVNHFFSSCYEQAVYWEHGVFHQTVFHAHLHCFPFGPVKYHLEEQFHHQRIHTQDDIRHWYQNNGHYFYLEDTHQRGYLFPPQTDDYTYVIKNVLHPGVVAHSHHPGFRPPQQRYSEGKPLISSLIAKWQTFQNEISHKLSE